MSALRLGRRPDGKRIVVIEEPARVSGYGQGNTHDLTLIGGSFVQGEPGEVERQRQAQREFKARHRA